MSWDIALFKFPSPLTRAEEADHAPLLPLGALADVHAAILGHFPGTDWSDPAWGCWEEDWNFSHSASSSRAATTIPPTV